MPSKFLNISTDTTLGGSSASDSTVSSQKAIKAYVDSQTGATPAFANITGQPTDNTNLASALNAKYDASNPNGYTSNVGTVTSVNNTSPDSGGNVSLSIPAAQVNSDWNASSGVAQILNKPSFATVATSGSYSDLSNKPTIPTMADIIDSLYPVGSIYIGVTSTCPLASIKGTWTLVSSGRVLQGASAGHNAGTTIEAGLPNITGSGVQGYEDTFSGAITGTYINDYGGYMGGAPRYRLNFNASRSNSIYGKSSTVQPPAYVVNIWQRTA